MNKDRALEELFLANKPQFDDKEAFMTSLTKRLDAVEYIKQYQEATIRRYKMAVVVSTSTRTTSISWNGYAATPESSPSVPSRC